MKNTQISGNNGSGYRLRKISKTGLYQIHSGNHGAFEGDLLSIWQKMVWEFEMSNSDIRIAIEEMGKLDHNVANFGIHGGFLFTQKD